MAKMRQVIGGAVLEVEGDEAACAEAARVFHLALAENALHEVEERLRAMKPLQKQRRELVKRIAVLSETPVVATVQ